MELIELLLIKCDVSCSGTHIFIEMSCYCTYYIVCYAMLDLLLCCIARSTVAGQSNRVNCEWMNITRSAIFSSLQYVPPRNTFYKSKWSNANMNKLLVFIDVWNCSYAVIPIYLLHIYITWPNVEKLHSHPRTIIINFDYSIFTFTLNKLRFFSSLYLLLLFNKFLIRGNRVKSISFFILHNLYQNKM